jgi:hypothetical protein
MGSITRFSRIISDEMKFGPLFTSMVSLNPRLSFFHDAVKRFIVFGTTKLQDIVCIRWVPPRSGSLKPDIGDKFVRAFDTATADMETATLK